MDRTSVGWGGNAQLPRWTHLHLFSISMVLHPAPWADATGAFEAHDTTTSPLGTDIPYITHHIVNHSSSS